MGLPSSVREAFALFDKDGDGEIAGNEAVLVIRSCGVVPTNEEINNLPGQMNWPQFEQWMSKKLEKCNPEDDLKKLFKVFDRAGDGSISSDELQQVMKTLGELLTDDEIDQLIKEADPGKSGRINYGAFIKTLLA